MKKIIFFVIASFFVIGCLPNLDEMTPAEQREYWHKTDPESARNLDFADAMLDRKEQKEIELDSSMTNINVLRRKCELKESKINFLMNKHNFSCKKFVSSLNDKQLNYYSQLVDAEKENNLPKSELYKRKFYKSLSKGKIEELKALSTSLDEINVNSREVKAYEKDLEREKENAIATAKEIDKITRDFHRFMALMENQSYAPINATSVLDPLMRSLNEWQQNLNQQRTASRQNYNMMQMNNSLNNIASSLNSIDSTLKY